MNRNLSLKIGRLIELNEKLNSKNEELSQAVQEFDELKLQSEESYVSQHLVVEKEPAKLPYEPRLSKAEYDNPDLYFKKCISSVESSPFIYLGGKIDLESKFKKFGFLFGMGILCFIFFLVGIKLPMNTFWYFYTFLLSLPSLAGCLLIPIAGIVLVVLFGIFLIYFIRDFFEYIGDNISDSNKRKKLKRKYPALKREYEQWKIENDKYQVEMQKYNQRMSSKKMELQKNYNDLLSQMKEDLSYNRSNKQRDINLLTQDVETIKKEISDIACETGVADLYVNNLTMLSEIYRMIYQGRADSVKEALNVLAIEKQNQQLINIENQRLKEDRERATEAERKREAEKIIKSLNNQYERERAVEQCEQCAIRYSCSYRYNHTGPCASFIPNRF